ncbi:glycogen synthase [bacterium]|nr:glycogen synthase [bacterium]
MSRKYKILMALPEISPFTRTGELSDLGGSIPKELKDLGHDIRLITPQYRVIDERRYILRDVIRLQDIEIPLGGEKVTINVKSSFLPNSKIQVYFIDYKPFFARIGLYKDHKSGVPFKDNAKRFILFSKSVLETLIRLQWQPDVIHCHGWQAGLIPWFLKTIYNTNPFFDKCSTLFTVYDFAESGVFDKSCAEFLSSDNNFSFENSSLNLKGDCSFLRGGVAHADFINTLSDTYLKDVLNGCDSVKKVYDVVKERKGHFASAVNGIDYTEWNPQNDSLISSAFSSEEIEGREENRKALREELSLKTGIESPVVCMITELESRKGIDLVKESLEKLMKNPIGLIVMGSGTQEFETFFTKAEKKWKGRIRFINSFAKDKLHLVVAGSDMVLIPSLYEPCGFTQLYCMRYGTVPIVRLTGGLVDTIIPVTNKKGEGTGFTFEKYSATGLLKGINSALKFWANKEEWKNIQKRCMQRNSSWEIAATRYVSLYEKCVNEKQ